MGRSKTETEGSGRGFQTRAMDQPRIQPGIRRGRPSDGHSNLCNFNVPDAFPAIATAAFLFLPEGMLESSQRASPKRGPRVPLSRCTFALAAFPDGSMLPGDSGNSAAHHPWYRAGSTELCDTHFG